MRSVVSRVATTLILVLVAAALVPRAALAATSAAQTQRVSVTSAGNQGLYDSAFPAVSGDGRYVTFQSVEAFGPDDTNYLTDIYVRDRLGGTTSRVSVSATGGNANAQSTGASISGDGSRILFTSYASNLAPGDEPDTLDLFLRESTTGTTTKLPIVALDDAPLFVEQASLTGDGRSVAFASENRLDPDHPDGWGVYLYDILTARARLASISSSGEVANAGSLNGAASADGRIIAFRSDATNLVPDDTATCGLVFPPQNCPDIYVHDMQTGETRRITISATGEQANGFSFDPTVSADGRYVAYLSAASNLVPGDTNQIADVFVYDRTTASTRRVSVSSAGAEANSNSLAAVISGDGSTVAFVSGATNLDPHGRRGIFVHRLDEGTTVLASLTSTGDAANGSSDQPVMTPNGGMLVFRSAGTNLVPGDTNNSDDVFLRDLAPTPTQLIADPVVIDLARRALNFPTLTAHLSYPGGPLAFRRVEFYAGNSLLCSAITRLDGSASCTGTSQALSAIATLGYRVTFAGDWPFSPSEGRGDLIR